ncbi:uncharacterized protein LOC120143359 [Hibiscus syriacus]|uniref:uncharacterized protein LOC120143359 n=1 Tax=Hibiscus syriacus TaxID=106335 RepID=UPI001920D6C6|nr:uncharacterized protein LOC120143359 [Hibiscus syriacus]
MYDETDRGEGLEHSKFMTHLNKERLYEFLARLNRELDEVCGHDALDVRLTKTQLETLHKLYGTSNAHGSLATQEDDSSEIEKLKEFFSAKFELNDLGNLKYFLGIEVVRSKADIAFGVSVINQYMHTPREKHLEVTYKILRYLKGTSGKGLHFKKTSNWNVEVYTDADWAGSANDRHSTSGYYSYV